MENEKPNPTGGNVMDIQRQNPQSQNSDQNIPDAASVAQQVNMTEPDQKPLAPVPAGVLPDESQAQNPETPVPANKGLSPELLAEAQGQTGGTDDQKVASSANALLEAKAGKRKSKKPVAVIVIAVLVFSALAGLAVYAYTYTQEENTNLPAADNSQTEQTNSDSVTEPVQPATADEVKDAAQELDNAVNAPDEATELPEDGLNEQSTGL